MITSDAISAGRRSWMREARTVTAIVAAAWATLSSVSSSPALVSLHP